MHSRHINSKAESMNTAQHHNVGHQKRSFLLGVIQYHALSLSLSLFDSHHLLSVVRHIYLLLRDTIHVRACVCVGTYLLTCRSQHLLCMKGIRLRHLLKKAIAFVHELHEERTYLPIRPVPSPNAYHRSSYIIVSLVIYECVMTYLQI